MTKKRAIAIVHYHLHPGGVTRVIERAVEALGDQVDLLVLAGESPAPDAALAPLAEPFSALGYSDHPILNAEQQVENLRATARRRLGRDPDLWHIHNPALGKNHFMPQLAWHLANAGCRLLLQPHDFAEDGRPQNYRTLREYLHILYPIAHHVWYAPINRRDQAFLEGIGLANVHALPNSVTALQPQESDEDIASTKTIVYPARAIRRKNLGEFLLWSLLAPAGYRFISTLAPKNPHWQPIHNEWVAFAQELHLPVEFDAGKRVPFPDLVQGATALMSTSIAEGFGLAFLEPWLEGKALIGRNLPEITADFEAEGLDLSALYSSLPIPLEWIGEEAFFKTLKAAMQSSYAAYSTDWNPEVFEQAKAALVTEGQVDFGLLDEPLQRRAIQHLVEHPADRSAFPEFAPCTPHSIEHNRNVVLERYSPEAYGQRLLSLYQHLAATPPGKVSAANANALLEQFLQPARFNLLRT